MPGKRKRLSWIMACCAWYTEHGIEGRPIWQSDTAIRSKLDDDKNVSVRRVEPPRG